ncbi:MAG TPA: hypothetical protein VM327_02920 [Candidatus Thermoplasmatota archaeon]|nr:hypothetical protein [Candidatus Thermoplasmatota archaeon]
MTDSAAKARDTALIEELVGDLIEGHDLDHMLDGRRVHILRLDLLMSNSKGDKVREEVRARLARGLPPDWEVLPGSVLIRSPRRMHVIVPLEFLP